MVPVFPPPLPLDKRQVVDLGLQTRVQATLRIPGERQATSQCSVCCYLAACCLPCCFGLCVCDHNGEDAALSLFDMDGWA